MYALIDTRSWQVISASKEEDLTPEENQVVVYMESVNIWEDLEETFSALITDVEHPLCATCAGSGEGTSSGSRCWRCNGLGVLLPKKGG